MHAASAENISEKEELAQHHGSPAGSAGLSQRASKAQQHLALEPGTHQSQNETADSEWSSSISSPTVAAFVSHVYCFSVVANYIDVG